MNIFLLFSLLSFFCFADGYKYKKPKGGLSVLAPTNAAQPSDYGSPSNSYQNNPENNNSLPASPSNGGFGQSPYDTDSQKK